LQNRILAQDKSARSIRRFRILHGRLTREPICCSPIPTLFKERLFVYLSRFCEVRYCITRHCGFLLGLGHSAGDASAPPMTVKQVIRLLHRPVPTEESTSAALAPP
jgi:hypothetical protein